MRRIFNPIVSLCFVFSMLIAWGAVSPTVSYGQDANKAKLDKAMSITPRQKIDYEKPTVKILAQCKFLEKKDKPSGFIVYHESGRVLRQFFDNNGDGKLDQWSYFKGGIEVYRDLDTNFDGTTDQYRWLGEAGTRWGIDSNQDGTIDSWKVISPEEVSYECFEAIRNLDQERFNRLLLTPAEFTNLQLGTDIAKDVQKRWQKAKSGFLTMARGQRVINSQAKWVYAGNGQASMTAAGTDGNKRDLIAYDHGSGFFDSGGVRQLGVGTIIKVGDVWRLIELPEVVDPKKPLSNGGALLPMARVPGWNPQEDDARDRKIADLHDKMGEIEKRLQAATGVQIQKLEKAKADILVEFYKIYDRADEKQTRRDWLEHFSDSVSSAYQSDRYDDGLKHLAGFIKGFPRADGLDYVQWRMIFADYSWVNEHGDKKERDAAAAKLNVKLKEFQKAYAKSPFAADALVQLAVADEVQSVDEPQKAIGWYNQCKGRFSQTSFGKRSTGAVTRLSGMGRTFAFEGQTLDKRVFKIQNARGKIVVLHFWETWCPSIGFEELAKINEKFNDVAIVSCNIEAKTEDFKKFFAKNKSKLPWTHLHSPGSVDESPLAHQLGIATLPMLILVDKEGKLVQTNIAISDLEREIVRERRR